MHLARHRGARFRFTYGYRRFAPRNDKAVARMSEATSGAAPTQSTRLVGAFRPGFRFASSGLQTLARNASRSGEMTLQHAPYTGHSGARGRKAERTRNLAACTWRVIAEQDSGFTYGYRRFAPRNDKAVARMSEAKSGAAPTQSTRLVGAFRPGFRFASSGLQTLAGMPPVQAKYRCSTPR
ncbi:hypothetical protein RPC_0808 [Rhodopseudomonas palustris BisB18]|uniref:Uncharacterized protein n=1 Tax=Rhodopseudomonas palustris (strain BisB18) TaxID=316056 RepID=Q21B57_RHOPB